MKGKVGYAFKANKGKGGKEKNVQHYPIAEDTSHTNPCSCQGTLTSCCIQ